MAVEDIILRIVSILAGVLIFCWITIMFETYQESKREDLKNEIILQIEEKQETETEKHYCQWCGKVFELPDEKCDEKCEQHCLEWLKQPAEGER